MASITPDRMPYVRRETIGWLQEYGRVFYEEQYQLSDSAAIAALDNKLSPDKLIRLECERLLRGSMYHVDKDLCELVKHAAPEMPEFAPTPYDLPSPFGFLWWDGDVVERPHANLETIIYILDRICAFEDVRKTAMLPVVDMIDMLQVSYFMTRDEAIAECARIAMQAGRDPGARIQTRCSVQDLTQTGALKMLSYIGGRPSSIRAVTWGPYGVEENGEQHPGAQRIDGVIAGAVWVSFWAEPTCTENFWPSLAKKPSILVENEILYPWYMHNDEFELLVSKDVGSIYSWFHVLLATIRLSKQTNLATITPQRADRAERKRIRRISDKASDSVFVTRLRPSHSGSGSPSGDRKIGKDHRFMVGGHWRNVWCGSHTDPARPRVQRPQWILPFVKGADGAPLVIRDRVIKL